MNVGVGSNPTSNTILLSVTASDSLIDINDLLMEKKRK